MPDQASKLRYSTVVLLLGFAALLAFAGLEALPRAGADPWASASGSPQRASSIFSQSSSTSSSQRCMPRDPVRAVRLGDTVEIRVFETLEPEEGGPATRYERRDLSATAVVDAAGESAFGSFGRLTVAGVLPLCIEQEIAARIAKTMAIKVSASATFASRAPITVGGTVATPGTYPYTGGLTVQRLLAMSGGSGESQADKRRRQVLEAREAELLLQRHRLETELNNADSWQPPAQLRKTMELAMGLDMAAKRIAGERALFASARAMRLAAWASDEAERDALVAARDLALLQENAMREGLDEATVRRDSLAEELSDDCPGR
ncbi:MAG: SLBB domain-containing protein, partial [Sulfitobacter sp.]|nr:SLBB domain-containing protein [Sulfitobacter sp.]